MQLFYRSYGSHGTPILALHGLYASHGSWIGLAGALSQSHRLILVDLRNHGRSPHAPEHSYPLISKDLLELLDKLAIDSAILMGHSMGGKAAMHFALNHPERTEGLIVEDTSPLSYLPNSENAALHQKIVKTLKLLPIGSYTTHKELLASLLRDIPDTTLCRFLLKNIQQNKNGALEWRINLATIEKNLPSIMESVVTESTKPAKIPSLFIKGSLSAYVVEKDEKAIRYYFPRSLILTVQNAGHTPHNEQEACFLESVNQYFSLLNSTD